MPNFTGQLNSNEIFASLYNMIISQYVFADNISNAFTNIANRMRVDGSLYGDTKLYFSTDILESVDWQNDSEAGNLLALHRPPAPKVQAIVLDVFRQISVTVDQYLSKRSWSTEYAFSQFNSVMLGWIRETKRVYDYTLMSSFIGTNETTKGKQSQTINLPTDANAEAQARLQAQFIAKKLADVLIDVSDTTRDYNDNLYLRSYNPENLIVVWNSDVYNSITYLDLPTIFHKDELFKNLDEMTLPARFFGDVNTNGGTAPEENTTIRSLIETRYAVDEQADDPRARLINGQWIVHVFPGDLLPNGSTYLANETYTQNNNILCKIIFDKCVPYMSAFEVGTSFFNPKSLTENHYLTFGHNTLEHLEEKPFITIKKA